MAQRAECQIQMTEVPGSMLAWVTFGCLITTHVRSMMGGYVFIGVCSTLGGDTPSLSGGVPDPALDGGGTQSNLGQGGTHLQGVPHPISGGYPISRGTPSHVWGGSTLGSPPLE